MKILQLPFRTLLRYALGIALSFGVLVLVTLALYAQTLPSPKTLSQGTIPASSKIFDRNGVLLYEIYGEYKRTPISLDDISPNLVNATIAIEDKNFYKHGAIDPAAMVRAAWANFKAKSITQGASTITQQLAKNGLLTRDRSWKRKMQEILLAFRIEKSYDKQEILGMYLNQIPYGRNAYGAEAASQTYFGKHAKDLSVAESAYLAALPQAPSFYTNTTNTDLLTGRKNLILARMKELHYITQEEYEKAKEQEVVFRTISTPIHAPYFVMWIESYLKSKYPETLLEEGGLNVYTTLDMRLQKIAEDAVGKGAALNEKRYNAYNASLVALDPKTGQVLAYVGGKDYFGKPQPSGCTSGKNCLFDPHVNIPNAPLQPGSSFKVYTYLTAFSQPHNYAPASMILDHTENFDKGGIKPYIPHNYNGREYGLVSMRKALAGSLNIAAVRTLSLIGVDNVAKTAHDLGITTPLSNCGLSLTLGGCEVKLLDHTSGYAVLANGGIKNDVTPILKIEDRKHMILEEYHAQPKRVADEQAVYEINSILTDNDARSFVFGKRSPLTLTDRPAAAKTGTTQKFHDGWTLGFTPQLAAGVWVGNNDGTLLRDKADGVVVAAPIWHAFMEAALKDQPVLAFNKPEGIQEVKVNPYNGLLATSYSPSTREEIFASYSVPTKYDYTKPPEADPTELIDIGLDVGGLPSNELQPSTQSPDTPSTHQPIPTATASSLSGFLHKDKGKD